MKGFVRLDHLERVGTDRVCSVSYKVDGEQREVSRGYESACMGVGPVGGEAFVLHGVVG